MTWLKIDDKFTEHPKVMGVGGWGAWLHLQAIAYCNRNLTDGFVPFGALETLKANGVTFEEPDGALWKLGATSGMSGRETAEFDWPRIMIDAGLWEPAPGGIRVHDYHEYNPSKQEVLAGRGERSAGKAAGGHARMLGASRDEKGRLVPSRVLPSNRRDAGGNSEMLDKSPAGDPAGNPAGAQDAGSSNPAPGPVPGPLPSPKGNGVPETHVPASRTKRGARALEPAFEIFWNSFPRLRRLEKPKAVRAWAGLSPEERVLATDGVTRLRDAYAQSPPERVKFIPYPERWLKNHRWEDPPEEVARQAAPERIPSNGQPPRVPGAPSRPPGVTFAPDGSWLTYRGERFDRHPQFERRGISGWYHSIPDFRGEGGGFRLDGSSPQIDPKWNPAEYVDFFRRHGVPGLPEKLIVAIGCFPSAMKEPAEDVTESKPVKADA